MAFRFRKAVRAVVLLCCLASWLPAKPSPPPASLLTPARPEGRGMVPRGANVTTRPGYHMTALSSGGETGEGPSSVAGCSVITAIAWRAVACLRCTSGFPGHTSPGRVAWACGGGHRCGLRPAASPPTRRPSGRAGTAGSTPITRSAWPRRNPRNRTTSPTGSDRPCWCCDRHCGCRDCQRGAFAQRPSRKWHADTTRVETRSRCGADTGQVADKARSGVWARGQPLHKQSSTLATRWHCADICNSCHGQLHSGNSWLVALCDIRRGQRSAFELVLIRLGHRSAFAPNQRAHVRPSDYPRKNEAVITAQRLVGAPRLQAVAAKDGSGLIMSGRPVACSDHSQLWRGVTLGKFGALSARL